MDDSQLVRPPVKVISQTPVEPNGYEDSRVQCAASLYETNRRYQATMYGIASTLG
jgi:hypothetical protein